MQGDGRKYPPKRNVNGALPSPQPPQPGQRPAVASGAPAIPAGGYVRAANSIEMYSVGRHGFPDGSRPTGPPVPARITPRSW